MKARSISLVLMVLSLAVLATLATQVGADSISVTTDHPVHALGQSVAITVAYMGGVHGDVKLSIEDSSGAVMNDWSWGHASSDPFQQSVSYAPTKPGTYTIKALHQPHHMEPAASASTQAAFWSARVVNLQYANTVNAGKPVDVTATVSYYFTQPASVKLELWSNSENKLLGTLSDTLEGQGTKTMTISNIQFTSVQNQVISARIQYQTPGGGWTNDPSGWNYNGKITVVPEFAVAPALLLLISLLSLAFVRNRTSRKLAK